MDYYRISPGESGSGSNTRLSLFEIQSRVSNLFAFYKLTLWTGVKGQAGLLVFSTTVVCNRKLL